MLNFPENSDLIFFLGSNAPYELTDVAEIKYTTETDLYATPLKPLLRISWIFILKIKRPFWFWKMQKMLIHVFFKELCSF